jgi:hypothetical protein
MCNSLSQALFDALECVGHMCSFSRFKPHFRQHLYALQSSSPT